MQRFAPALFWLIIRKVEGEMASSETITSAARTGSPEAEPDPAAEPGDVDVDECIDQANAVIGSATRFSMLFGRCLGLAG